MAYRELVIDGSASTLAPAMRRGAVSLDTVVSVISERQVQVKFGNIFMPTSKVEELPARLGLEPSAADKAKSLPGSPRKAAAPLKGALAGVPVVLSNNIDVKDVPTTGGNQILETSKPQSDAPAVAFLKSAGAFVVGQAVSSELNQSILGTNQAYGSPKNVSATETRQPNGRYRISRYSSPARVASTQVCICSRWIAITTT